MFDLGMCNLNKLLKKSQFSVQEVSVPGSREELNIRVGICHIHFCSYTTTTLLRTVRVEKGVKISFIRYS